MRHVIFATVLMALPAIAAGQATSSAGKGEIGYPVGALGYDALMAGDIKTAEAQLLLGPAAKDDPAVLINLGQVYAQKGDSKRAAELFKRALEAEPEELVLGSGRVVDSREAAAMALRQVTSTASR